MLNITILSGSYLLNMTTIGNVISVNFFGFQGSYLLNITTTGNNSADNDTKRMGDLPA